VIKKIEIWREDGEKRRKDKGKELKALVTKKTKDPSLPAVSRKPRLYSFPPE
jgi:hypothetical protein